MGNYTGHREVSSCDFGPRNGAENVSDTVQCFELFFDKEIIHQIVRETNKYAEQYKSARGNLFSFRSLVRSWTPVTESEIYTVLGLFIDGHCAETNSQVILLEKKSNINTWIC